jgi:hypothetical protein
MAELLERALNCRAGFADELGKRRGRLAGCRFCTKRSLLRIGEHVTARVRKQAVESAAKMTYMEPDGRSAPGRAQTRSTGTW